ncbi:DVU0298 family protein [Oleidesulfovibrio sp.]|uniref:DVU0298 family protein n=1 Tax=Oleidesulfovibrio sp. TaxID=2909707 RepID=UPI003A8965CE
MAKFRSLKTRIRCLLLADDWEQQLDHILALPSKEAVGPLFSFLLFGGEMKWRAVTALGLVVASMADTRMEDARVVMRRLLWHMNEESGNIGWGIAEAMAEIMANHSGLAGEYDRMLISYIRETGDDDNYLDHPPLRRGVYWGIGRLAQVEPDKMRLAVRSLTLALEDEDAQGRGLAAWALTQLGGHIPADAVDELRTRLTALTDDPAEVELFAGRQLLCVTTGQLAREALAGCAGLAS